MNNLVTFQQAIEVVESLPYYQQEDLIHIVYRRLAEHKRNVIAENIKKAREEYDRGEVKRGTVEDLIKEISE
ncbi:MAG: hypothetical protein HQK77_01760 [Desulfobacterales bacterium]|nr:hypothetical protein [Desulfobacterales bacterium]